MYVERKKAYYSQILLSWHLGAGGGALDKWRDTH